MIDYQKLLNWPFPEIEHRLSKRDTMLYALGVGFGADPVDRNQLRFVYEKDLAAVPSMASILCHPGNWLRNPETGVDYRRMVNGGTAFSIYEPLPVEGTLVCRPRVLEIVDKGPGKGAVLTLERKVHDKATGRPVCTVISTSVCRADGGFGGPPGAAPAPPPMPRTASDASVTIAVARNLALLYRLNGDYNPLHADPDVAHAAGFKEPILHGLATLGIVTHALLQSCCDYDPARLTAMEARYTAPVIPGDSIRTDIWRDGGSVQFRAVVAGRNAVVLDHGTARIS